MDNFELDVTLDDAAEARIAHAVFLEKIKDWAVETGELFEPFKDVMRTLLNPNSTPADMKEITIAFPIGVKVITDKLNQLYDMFMAESVEVLGEPFTMHQNHSPYCEGTTETCGHQDHYRK